MSSVLGHFRLSFHACVALNANCVPPALIIIVAPSIGPDSGGKIRNSKPAAAYDPGSNTAIHATALLHNDPVLRKVTSPKLRHGTRLPTIAPCILRVRCIDGPAPSVPRTPRRRTMIHDRFRLRAAIVGANHTRTDQCHGEAFARRRRRHRRPVPIS